MERGHISFENVHQEYKITKSLYRITASTNAQSRASVDESSPTGYRPLKNKMMLIIP